MGLSKRTEIKIEGTKYAWLGDQPRVHLSVDKMTGKGWICEKNSEQAIREAVRRNL